MVERAIGYHVYKISLHTMNLNSKKKKKKIITNNEKIKGIPDDPF